MAQYSVLLDINDAPLKVTQDNLPPQSNLARLHLTGLNRNDLNADYGELS